MSWIDSYQKKIAIGFARYVLGALFPGHVTGWKGLDQLYDQYILEQHERNSTRADQGHGGQEDS